MVSKIGVITSGGDSGGLNAVIKGAAKMANSNKIQMVVIPNGYAGLYNLIHMDRLVELNVRRVDEVNIGLAGSDAGHSRVKIKKIIDEDKYNRIKKGLEKHGIDALVISGGDDTGNVIVDLNGQGIKCVHAPKTMDLNLQTYSVGGDSAIDRITNFAKDLKTTGRSHNRVMVLEVFGRYEGHTAFRGGIAADADVILIPEIPVDMDAVYDHLKAVYMRRIRDSDINAGMCMVIVAEGIRNADGSEYTDQSAGVDAFGHAKLAGAGKAVARELERRFKTDHELEEFMKEQGMFVEGIYERPEIRDVSPSHLVRCGYTSAYDANFGMAAGGAAVQLIMNGIYGVTVVGIEGNQVSYISTKQAIKQRNVDNDEVAFFEQLGFNFGRKPAEFKPNFREEARKVTRIY